MRKERAMARSLTSDAILGFVLKLLGSVILFGLSVYLSRRLGAEYFGIFSLFMSVLLPLSVLARLGFDIDLLRLVARSRPPIEIRSRVLYRQSLRVVLSASLAIAILLQLLRIWSDPRDLALELPRLASWLGLALPFHAVLMLNAAFIRGSRRVVWAAAYENVLVNLLLWALFLLSIEVWSVHLSEPVLVAGIALASLASCVQTGLLLRNGSGTGTSAEFPSIPERARHALPMLVTALANIGFATLDVLLLSFYVDNAALGYYAAASKLAGFINFPIIAVMGMVGPRLSDADARNDNASLRKTYREATRLAGLAGMPVVLAIFFFPGPLLAIFGGGFGSAVTAVYILLAGHLANLLMGPVSYLLWMTGHAATLQKVTLFALAFFMLASLILMPLFGLEGAAAALSAAFILQSLGCIWSVRSRLGFNPLLCSWMPPAKHSGERLIP